MHVMLSKVVASIDRRWRSDDVAKLQTDSVHRLEFSLRQSWQVRIT